MHHHFDRLAAGELQQCRRSRWQDGGGALGRPVAGNAGDRLREVKHRRVARMVEEQPLEPVDPVVGEQADRHLQVERARPVEDQGGPSELHADELGGLVAQVEPALDAHHGVVGQQGKFTTASIQDYLRAMIVQRFTETLGAQHASVIDLPSQYGELSAAVKGRLGDDFSSLGLQLAGFYVNAVSPTEETAKAIEERGAMGAVGNLDDYMKFKAARAMGDAAVSVLRTA